MKFLTEACCKIQQSEVKPSAWIFDLDNTLFASGREIFPLINEKMTQYIERHLCVERNEANRLRKLYWDKYGATLLGLVRHHAVDAEDFLKKTHDIGELHSLASRSSRLIRLFRQISGKKIVFSNSPTAYLEKMLRLLGIRRFLAGVFSIESTNMNPKPSMIGFRKVLKTHRLEASRCVMVEDSLINLFSAKRLGMKTVWVTRELNQPNWVDAKVRRLY
ncbi:MAG: pyrimidine 5'-nucleotidase [Proteobacteria bacterium]|nr:pyrimidine 5'-nucleotidase [Pseudomonadota bacterium]